jgi:xylulokinase
MSTATVIRPALLWNDTRSGAAAEQLVRDLGDGDPALGAQRWAQRRRHCARRFPDASKLRWLAEHEPHHAARIAAVALPHDWLTWRLGGATALDRLTTDRSDASARATSTPERNEYRRDLLALALVREQAAVASIRLPRVLDPNESAGLEAMTLD